MIKDSGDRTEFETGAKRDMHAGKGRMDLLPWYGIMEVSKHCEEGALKYGEHNVDKGIPLHSLLDSASRHLAKYMVGMDDEDHLRAACWNLLWALNQRKTHPELDDRFNLSPTVTERDRDYWVSRNGKCKHCGKHWARATGKRMGEHEVIFKCPLCGGDNPWVLPPDPEEEKPSESPDDESDEDIHCDCGVILGRIVHNGLKPFYPDRMRFSNDKELYLECPKCGKELMVLYPVWKEMGGVIVV